MISVVNQFIDWFLMRNENASEDAAQETLQLTASLADVTLVITEPNGKFPRPDAKENYLRFLTEALNHRPGVRAFVIPHSLNAKEHGNMADRFSETAKTGRELMAKYKADLLMWGTWESEYNAVRWHFLSMIESPAHLGMPGLAENLLIPLEPEDPVLHLLYATIFAATAPSHPSHAAKLSENLLNAIDPVTKLPHGLTSRKTSSAAQNSIMGMAAIVLANIAKRGDERGWFDPALKAFRQWEQQANPNEDPMNWALVRNHQAWLLEELAAREDNPDFQDHIEESTKYFKQVCEFFTQKGYPMEWASIQLRIANGYAKIGRLHTEPNYLQKAARFYKYAQEVFNMDRHPLHWADIMVRMAKTLMLHGQMIKGAQSLEQAGVAFQSALKVYTEDKYPAQWASTQNNLGATLFALAKRDPGTPEWVAHAILCFEAAKKYYEAHNKPKLVHVIDKNLTRAKILQEQAE